MLYAVDDMRYVLKVNPGVYYEVKDFTDQWYGRAFKPRKTDALRRAKVVSCTIAVTNKKGKLT